MEQVYCVATSDLRRLTGAPLPQGAFTGPSLEQILTLPQHFISRAQAETAPAYKQIIPYQLFCREDRVFVYQRGGGVGEQRLRGRYSVGVGGHINLADSMNGVLTRRAYDQALLREREEELICPPHIDSAFVGWINDDSDAVGQVHLGAVHCCRIDNHLDILIRQSGEDIISIGWLTKDEIKQMQDCFEKWSLLAISFQ